MADFFSTMAATQIVPSSRIDFENLDRVIQAARESDDGFNIESSIQAEYIDGEGVFLFVEDYFCDDDLSDDICSAIGRLLHSAGQEFLEFSFSVTCTRLMVGSHGGGSFRIYADGRLVWPNLTWPGE